MTDAPDSRADGAPTPDAANTGAEWVDTDDVTGLDHVSVVTGDGTRLLDEVTVLARPGEILVVLGPSGSGKSTLLRSIAGLQAIASGQVLINGRLAPHGTAARNLAMVFENTTLVPTMDLARNMAFGLVNHGVSATEADARVRRQSERLGLRRLLSRKPAGMSPGEQGQAGICRALVREPAAFLLDEPLAHLDAGERGRMRRLIAEQVRATGRSTLWVTHEPVEALSVADRIAVLRHGRVVQVAPAGEIYRRPADLFVADLVGARPLSRLPAVLVESAGMCGYRVGARTLLTWAPVPSNLAGMVGREVLLGLRAEQIEQADRDSDPDQTRLPGVVVSVESIGPVSHVAVDAAGHRLLARFDARTRVRPGESVMVQVDVAGVHVFDPDTGQALHHPD